MNPSARRQTSRNRDKALGRLNSITTGTAFAAALATAGFGALAAINYSGTSDAATTEAVNLDTGATATDDSTTTNPGATPTLKPTSAPVAATTKKAKVTSGGSH